MAVRYPDYDLYDELDLEPRASESEIRDAYLRLARIHHPDGGTNPWTERMARINRAHDVLSSPESRSSYDQWRHLRWGGPTGDATGQPSTRSSAPPPPPPPPSPAPPSTAPPPYSAKARQRFRLPGWVVGILVIIGVSWAVSAFQEQNQRDTINSQNAAASSVGPLTTSGASTNRPVTTSQTVDVFDLRIGDCFRGHSMGEVGSVTKVACSSPLADFEVTWLYRVPASTGGTYPGETYFDRSAMRECPVDTDSFYFPTSSSWGIGDRTVTCLAAR